MGRNNRYILAVFVSALYVLGCPARLHAQRIRIRASATENTSLVGKMVKRLHQREPKLVSRVDLSTWAPGFKRFADGDCAILVSSVFPNAADMKYLSWHLPVGAPPLREYIAGQQRVLVVVHKANPITSISFEQISKVLISTEKSVSWKDFGSTGGRVRVYLEPENSASIPVVRNKCLRKASGGNVIILDIREGVKHCVNGKAVVDSVRRDRNGIGFVLDSDVSLTKVKVLAVANSTEGAVKPLPGPVLQKNYPLSRWLLLYLHPEAPQGTKRLCKLLRGPVVADIAAESGFTTQTTVEQAKATRRQDIVKSGKAVPVRVVGVNAYSGFASDLARKFTIAKSPARADFTSVSSDHAAIGQFLARGDMVLLDNPPDDLAMRTFAQAWEDAMPVPFLHGARVAAVIVNRTNKLTSLTLGQVRAIFGGEVRDWAVIGGTGLSRLSRPRSGRALGGEAGGTGIRAFGLARRDAATKVFETECLPRRKFRRVTRVKDTAAAVAAVGVDPNAIAYVDLTAIPATGQAVKVLAIRIGRGKKAKVIKPTPRNIKNAMYPLSRRLYLYVNPKAGETAKRFAGFIATCGGSEATPYCDTVKAVMAAYRKHGLIPLADAATERMTKEAIAEAVKKAAAAKSKNRKGRRRK